MIRVRRLLLPAVVSCLMTGIIGPAHAEDTVDATGKTLDANGIKQGLFPDDECEQLKAAGFKCMGFKPAVKFSLPAIAFKPGSAELPEPLKAQLDTFAEALRGRPADSRKVRVEGHADASGDPELNFALSQRRAETAKDYLVGKGVDPRLLKAVGVGARDPKVASNPLAAENRRVVIGRDHDAEGAAAN
jgi:OmpA-OmpF porin, OOP family